MKLNECVNEYVDYQLSEGKDYNKTIKKYVSNINEMIKYLNINTVEELANKLFGIDIDVSRLEESTSTLAKSEKVE